MDTLEKYHQSNVPQLTHFENRDKNENDSTANLLLCLLKRWKIIILVFLSVFIGVTPVIWLTVKPSYKATAAIQVEPIIHSILFNDEEGIPMYKNFIYTQANLITSDQVLQRVADDLLDKKLAFFEQPDDIVTTIKNAVMGEEHAGPVRVLRKALADGKLTAIPEENTELIGINMQGNDPEEVAEIVNSLVRSYMAVVVFNEAKDENHRLAVLEKERKVLIDKLERERASVRAMAQEFGTYALKERQDMMLKRLASLLAELTRIELHKISLQAKVNMLEGIQDDGMISDELMKMKYEFINSDLIIKNITENIVELEKNLLVAKQTLAKTNPELQRQEKVLEMLNEHLEKRRKEVEIEFDEMVEKGFANNDKKQLKNAKAELEQTIAYEKHLRQMLNTDDTETITLGRKQLAIQDMQDKHEMTKELHQAVRQRIHEIEMEKKRSAQISVAYYANILPPEDKRIKFTAAILFIAAALGMLTALVKDKFDMSLNTPEDITKHVGSRIIGTTTRPESVRKKLLPQQLAEEYQTICANLGLFSNGGIPKTLVVSSPGAREGKTTLAINLATSIAKTGKRVLLIDGDLRKPDVARLLKLPAKCNGLQELLSGKKFKDVACMVPDIGLAVLTADSYNIFDIYELITQPRTTRLIEMLNQRYEHIIIDSPPALVVPDALLWAKMVDGVLLTIIAGQTEKTDLKETMNRFQQIDVNVVGTVLNNVAVNYSYNQYGYGYSNTGFAGTSDKKTKIKKLMLLPLNQK